jgi:hypothetical protein
VQIDQPNEVVGCEITTYGNQPNTAGRKEKDFFEVQREKNQHQPAVGSLRQNSAIEVFWDQFSSRHADFLSEKHYLLGRVVKTGSKCKSFYFCYFVVNWWSTIGWL